MQTAGAEGAVRNIFFRLLECTYWTQLKARFADRLSHICARDPE
jgi:hypothetical protein